MFWRYHYYPNICVSCILSMSAIITHNLISLTHSNVYYSIILPTRPYRLSIHTRSLGSYLLSAIYTVTVKISSHLSTLFPWYFSYRFLSIIVVFVSIFLNSSLVFTHSHHPSVETHFCWLKSSLQSCVCKIYFRNEYLIILLITFFLVFSYFYSKFWLLKSERMSIIYLFSLLCQQKEQTNIQIKNWTHQNQKWA